MLIFGHFSMIFAQSASNTALFLYQFEILKTDSAVRAHVHYMPQLQLIRELDIYIDPEVQADVFGQSGKLSAYFLMTFFNLRNEEAKKQVKELLKIKRQCDLSPEEKIEL